MRRSFYRCVGTRAESDGVVLGEDLTVVGGSIRWTCNLPDRADMVAHGGAAVARGGAWKDGQNLLRVRGSSKLVEIAQIHRTKANTPLLVVILAERGHDGGAIGSGSNYRRSSEGR